MNRQVTHRRRNRGLAFAGAVIATSALLGGCAESLPQPEPEAPAAAPVLSEEQQANVLVSVGSVLDGATKDRSAKALKPRLTGPALEVRTSQLQVAKARGDNSLVTQIPAEYQQVVVPTTETWPRTSYAITVPTENLETPRLVALEQASAREPYKLWGWVQLVPDLTMPAFADAEIGSAPVAPDDDSLLATPADALSQYADVLSRGTEKSKAAKNFEILPDDLVKRLEKNAANLRGTDSFEEAAAKYSMTFKPRGKDVRAVATADGGAVVMGVLEGKESLVAEEGATVPPLTETQDALLGDADATNTLRAEYTDMVALYVPPKDSDGKIRPLGFSHVATAASNK